MAKDVNGQGMDRRNRKVGIFCKPSNDNFYKKSALALLKKYGLEKIEEISFSDGQYIFIGPPTKYHIDNSRSKPYETIYNIPQDTSKIIEFLNRKMVPDPRTGKAYCVQPYILDGEEVLSRGEDVQIMNVHFEENDNPILVVSSDNPLFKAESDNKMVKIKAGNNKYITDHPGRAKRIIDYESSN